MHDFFSIPVVYIICKNKTWSAKIRRTWCYYVLCVGG